MHAGHFVESYFEAWNHRDPVRVAGHLCVDGTYIDVPANRQLSQRDLMTDLALYFAADHYEYRLVGEVLKGHGSIAFQYHMTPVQGNVRGRFGAEFITLTEQGALRIADYYDAGNIANQSPIEPKLSTKKYAKSGLDPARMELYSRRLVQVVEEQRVYMQPELTLPRLAGMVGCSINHLSQILNSKFEMTFFDFLNSYRVEEAKLILRDMSASHQSILDISFAVGFNSNSAFYSAFKKKTGLTPAQFRKSTTSKIT